MGVRCYLYAIPTEYEANLVEDFVNYPRRAAVSFDISIDKAWTVFLPAFSDNGVRHGETDDVATWAIRGRRYLPDDDDAYYYNTPADVDEIVRWLRSLTPGQEEMALHTELMRSLEQEKHLWPSPEQAEAEYRAPELLRGLVRVWARVRQFYERAHNEGLLVVSHIG